jgi:hypothetical protein
MAAPFMAAAMMAADAAAEQPVDLELVLAVDVSRSIDSKEAMLQREGYIRAFRHPEVIRAIQEGVLGRIAVTYVEWSGANRWRQIANWQLVDGPESAEFLIAMMGQLAPALSRRTSISGAIEHSLRQFKSNGFVGTRQTIDVSGDGPNNDGVPVTAARDAAVAAGVTVNGLPIVKDGGGVQSRYNIPNLDLYYENCVIGGPGAFIVAAEGFDDFARAVRKKLIWEIAGRRPTEPPQLIPAKASKRERIAPSCYIGEMLRSEIEG